MGKSAFISSKDEVVSPGFFLFLFFCLFFCCRSNNESASETVAPPDSFATSSSADEALGIMPVSDSLSYPRTSLIEKMWKAQQHVENANSASGSYRLPELFPVIQAGSELSFGQVEVNQQKVQQLRVANIGNDDLKIAWVDLPYGFSTKLSSTITLPCKASMYIPIQFTPMVPKRYHGVMYIRSNANNGTIRVTCEGMGVAAKEKISGLAGSIANIGNPAHKGDSLPVVVPSNLPFEAPLISMNQSYAVSANIADYSAAPPIGHHSLYGGYVRGFWLAVRIPPSVLRARIRIVGAESHFDPVIGVKSTPSGPYLSLWGAFNSYCDDLGRGGDESCVVEGSGLLYIRIYHCDDSESSQALFAIRVEPAGV